MVVTHNKILYYELVYYIYIYTLLNTVEIQNYLKNV